MTGELATDTEILHAYAHNVLEGTAKALDVALGQSYASLDLPGSETTQAIAEVAEAISATFGLVHGRLAYAGNVTVEHKKGYREVEDDNAASFKAASDRIDGVG